jgi:hypothetical protein
LNIRIVTYKGQRWEFGLEISMGFVVGITFVPWDRVALIFLGPLVILVKKEII